MQHRSGAGDEPLPDPSVDARYFGPYDPGPPPPPPAPVDQPAALPPGSPTPATSRRPMRASAVIGLAAATALLVGGGAGYGGARLAERSEPAAATTAPPDPTASATPGSDPSPTSAPTTGHSIDTVAVAKQVVPGTVMIKVGRATGSGFVLDDRGRIITNNHVVNGAADGDSIRVTFANGKRQKATLVGRSPSYDVAVIKVKASSALRPLRRGDSSKVEVGQPVVAVGAPLGLPGTVTSGIVSARNRPVSVQLSENADSPTAYIDAVQTDAPINPGNSGGPLVDAAGRVVGVNSAILTLGSGQAPSGNIGLGFAIPIDQVQTISRLLIKNGKATYPVLGADLDNASGGVEVSAVTRRGPAARAGLRRGDLITKIDGNKVSASEELIVAIRNRRPGQQVELSYERGSRRGSAKVKLGSKVG